MSRVKGFCSVPLHLLITVDTEKAAKIDWHGSPYLSILHTAFRAICANIQLHQHSLPHHKSFPSHLDLNGERKN